MSEERPEFDHLLHWVPDVEAAAGRYSAAGFPGQVNAHTAADWGLRNGGWRLDARYVEILNVYNEATYRASPYGGSWATLGPSAAELSEQGGGALTFAVNVRDAPATAERLRASGHTVQEITVAPEWATVSFHEVFLPDTPSWMPFFITYTPPREQVLAGIPAGAFDPGPHDLTGIVVETPEPQRSAARLGELLGIPATGSTVPLPGAEVVFEPGPDERITGVTVTGGPRPDLIIDGLRFRFAAPAPSPGVHGRDPATK